MQRHPCYEAEVATTDVEAEAARFTEVVRASEEEERRRLTQLLHDELQPLLYGAQLELAIADRLRGDPDTARLHARLGKAIELLARAITRARQITVDLSPPLQRGEGIAEALERLRVQMGDLHGLAVEVRRDAGVERRPAPQASALVQVVREVLLNLAHTGSARATVDVADTGAGLVLTVSDGGRGGGGGEAEPDVPDEALLGLLSLRARLQPHGATLTVLAAPGAPARVVITAPGAPRR